MPGFEYEIAATGTTYIREIGLAVRLSVLDADKTDDPKKHPPTTALFDLDAVRFPLRLRNFKKGDRFRPLGMSGSQKLKAFFVDHKISRPPVAQW